MLFVIDTLESTVQLYIYRYAGHTMKVNSIQHFIEYMYILY